MERDPQGLTGAPLYEYHGLVMRYHPSEGSLPGEVRHRNNNGHLVKTCNFQASDYLCSLDGGRFQAERDQQAEVHSEGQGFIHRDHHFGPQNHFSNVRRMAGNEELAINEEGVTRFGPNFTRPVSEFESSYNEDNEVTLEVKQTVCTKYSIANQGLVFTGTINEVNIWGTHPHEDQLALNQENLDQ